MSNTKAFVDHVVDLLSLAGPVEARSMFGGHGLYVGGAMFGLVDDDELFLKTDGESRPRFVAAGCRRWVYARRDGTTEDSSYFQPPEDAHEDPEAMLPWARLAIATALRARAEKDAKARAKAARRAAVESAAAAATRPASASRSRSKSPSSSSGRSTPSSKSTSPATSSSQSRSGSRSARRRRRGPG